uniref:Large ribosomal subunit protein uL4c n=1 Tax=Kuetzingia canaliculata TaxID=228262 RepID=A0A1Z1MP93_KUECA|nr:ribosomal protein L4 [Kuetzingia canaliculata]ARW67913.1 ribosomal protein L4 [Kuetzingia canaliculata]
MTIRKKLQYLVTKNGLQISNKIVRDIHFDINESQEKQMYCIHRALKEQITNGRIRNAHSKTRSEIRGGGKKPWKQKGTGRARAGSTRSPLWKGGGVIFGPKKRIYQLKINKKEKRLAIHTILYNKFLQTTIITEDINRYDKPNTKNAIETINKLGINLNNDKKILIIVINRKYSTYLSFRNISNIELIEAKNVNVLSLLKADIILMTLEALNEI